MILTRTKISEKLLQILLPIKLLEYFDLYIDVMAVDPGFTTGTSSQRTVALILVTRFYR